MAVISIVSPELRGVPGIACPRNCAVSPELRRNCGIAELPVSPELPELPVSPELPQNWCCDPGTLTSGLGVVSPFASSEVCWVQVWGM